MGAITLLIVINRCRQFFLHMVAAHMRSNMFLHTMHSSRKEGVFSDIEVQFLLILHKNTLCPLIEAILMSTHNIPFSIFKKIYLKNEFETAVVNEPSMFEPLKVCCIQNFFKPQ